MSLKVVTNQEKLEVSSENDLLTSLDVDELEALADVKLGLSSQARLDELLAVNSQGKITGEEAKELDQLLAKLDQLTILKTRARYTLKLQAEAAQE
ncbi:MAG: hypothetical protein IT422_11315 [Pirellulaceae bacterium]|jgi:hypothetical protein|nr:hypothetical protein [Pirellulaceae bacterium]